MIISKRRFISSAPALFGASLLSACSQDSVTEPYVAVAERTWSARPPVGVQGAALALELVRYATLAPSSHNTQCWKFEIGNRTISILPDLSLRCPAVDPDDHHLFVTLGCAAENLVQAALAHGLKAEPSFDAPSNGVRVSLAPAAAQASALFKAIPALQATALGIRNAFVNQPVEVASVRPQFAAAVGLAGRRPDLVVRFGRGPALPRSLRRPVQDDRV